MARNTKALKKAQAKGRQSDRTIGEEAGRLLRNKNLTYSQIADEIRGMFPRSQTSVKSVQWYASRLRAEGVQLPFRTPERDR